jgi:sugar lactone lactonase YvrE
MGSRRVAPTNRCILIAAFLFTVPPWLGALSAQTAPPSSYEIETLAGVPPGGAVGGGSAASFYFPSGVAVDSSGNVYVADTFDNVIRKVTPAGTATIFAGAVGVAGAADGAGSAARFYTPYGIAVDASGVVYVADSGNGTIRKITPDGVVTTMAGTAGILAGSDGTGAGARFNFPTGVAVDASGTVYVGDTSSDTIRKITPAGVVTTLAGSVGIAGAGDGTGAAATFFGPQGIAVDASGNIFVADEGNNAIRKVAPDGDVTTVAGLAGESGAGSSDGSPSAARFYSPAGIAVDTSGNLYVADLDNNTIRLVVQSGNVTTLAGTAGVTGSADGAGPAAEFNEPSAVALDAAGNVYVADAGNGSIRKINPAAVVTTFVGSAGSIGSTDGAGGAGGSARFNNPSGVCVDSSGAVYVADTNNDTIRKILPGGRVSTLAGTPGVAGSSDGVGGNASFNGPFGVSVDSSGDVYVSDSNNNTIRKISAAGAVTTLAGKPGLLGSADGTGSAARFADPRGIAVDGSGNLYVGDTGNNTLRKISPDGTVTTLAGSAGHSGSTDGSGSAARFYGPFGVAVFGSGNIFVADEGNNAIREITPAGAVTTLAGGSGAGSSDGAGSVAAFNAPSGLAVDGSGNVYVSDTDNSTIRRVTPAGTVSTLAGTPKLSGSADATGAAARFTQPIGIAVDTSGDIFVADAGNNSIRKGVPAAAGPAGPMIVQEPVSQSVNTGSVATFSVSATGSGSLAYQWYFNGSPIPGAFSASYTIYSANNAEAGAYAVTVTDESGTSTSVIARLTVEGMPSAAQTTRLTNLSVRAVAGSSPYFIDAGFVVSGADSASVLVRGDGPTLAAFGVTGVLPDPVLTLYGSNMAPVSTNAGWGGTTALENTFAQVGAFPLPRDSRDAALASQIATGAYTAQISSSSGDSGVALLEVFNAGPSTSSSRFINLSARSYVGSRAAGLVVGFAVSGTGTETVLIRGDGPSLSQFGVTPILASLEVTLYDSSGNPIASDIGWGNAPTLGPSPVSASIAPATTLLFTQIGAFPLASGSADCAIVATLPPGDYSVEVSGLSGSTGMALAEILEMP